MIDSAKAIGYGVENRRGCMGFLREKTSGLRMSANRSCTYDCGGRFGDE